MPSPIELIERLRPARHLTLWQLVADAGIDVSDWAIDRDGELIENPSANTYRNSQWSFGGGKEPIALCIWHSQIESDGTRVVVDLSIKSAASEFDALASRTSSPSEKMRLRGKITKARAFDRLVYEAWSKRKPVRVIVVEGEQSDLSKAAVESSKTSARELDPEHWYAHSYDPYTGQFQLVRGIEPPPRTAPDPFEGVSDPADDPDFQAAIENLSDTERDALIRTRIGQGPFRDALIKRWDGKCSVTGCAEIRALVASHIKPWSRCTTRAERLGDANGLLLTPNLDKLFDRGLISFDDRFRLIASPTLKAGPMLQLGIDLNLRLRSPAGDDLKPYLKWHRDNLFHSR